MEMTRAEKFFVNSPSHSKQVSERAARLVARIPMAPGQTYLDVGTGNGAAAIQIAREFGLQVTGVDADAAQIRLAQSGARNAANARFMRQDATRLEFEEASFDIVAAFRMLHHIPQFQDALAEMVRVLKPGGYLVLSDLVVPEWLEGMGKTIARGHVGVMTRARLENALFENEMTKIHHARVLLMYDAIFRKTG